MNNKYKYSVIAIMCCLILVFVIIENNRKKQDVIINEICPHNVNVVHNKLGYYLDYIELYNQTDSEINLYDYYLSDDINDLYKYSLEWYTIQPKDYVVVFVDKYTSGFAVSNGETIYLTQKNGNRMAIKIPIIADNQSIGYNRANDKWEVCEPTPRKDNVFANMYKESLSKPKVNYHGGFYDNPLYIEITGKGNIYYTLDGSQPTKDSLKYNGPIYIHDRSFEENEFNNQEKITLAQGLFFNESPCVKGTVIRAISIDENGYYGDELIETYFIGLKNKKGYEGIDTISIVVNPENLFDYENGIYVTGSMYDNVGRNEEYINDFTTTANYKMRGKGWRRDAVISLYDRDGRLLSVDETEIGIHGNSSAAFCQKSFNLYKKGDGYSSLFNLFNKNTKSIILKACGGVADAELLGVRIRDDINQKLISNLNIVSQNSTYAQVFINGEYWGVYRIQEKLNAQKFANYSAVDEDEVIAIKYVHSNYVPEIIAGDDDAVNQFNEIIEYAKKNDLASNDKYEELIQMIDINNYIDYWCAELYMGNVDWPDKNYIVWKTKGTNKGNIYSDGKWRWSLFDLDATAGIIDRYDYTKNMFEIEGHFRTSMYEDPLFSELIKNDKFVCQFSKRFDEISNSIFDYNRVCDITDKNLDSIRDNLIETQRRFYSRDYSVSQYEKEIEDFKQYYLHRKEYAQMHIEAFISNQ